MAIARRKVDQQPLSGLYARDFRLWLLENAALLRAGRYDGIDAVNIAEELEDMGRSEHRALGSHLVTLLQHLLKWQHQPARRGASWEVSINNARDAIAGLLADSPSLRPGLADLVTTKYGVARRNAAAETGVPPAALPEQCPYTLAQLLDEQYWSDD